MNLKALKEQLNDVKEAKKELLKNAIETRSLVKDDELVALDNKNSDLQKQIENTEAELRANSVE